MKTLRAMILVAGLLAPAADAMAELVVIANPKSGIDRLSHGDVINIFLGRYRQLPSGLAARPADLPATQPERAAFYRQLVNKELAEINSYWARLVFSGRTVPPAQTSGNEDLLKWIAATPGGIGYVERAKADGRVRIVFELAP